MARLARVAALAAAATLSAAAHAGEVPKVEAGIGVASALTPTYRGSSRYGTVTVPFPYFVYRGDRVRLTRSGIRARASDWEYFSVGLSGSMQVPGREGEDPAREGMPDLEPMFEIGPSFDWTFAREGGSWCLCVPLRAAIYTGSGPSSAGWVANPQLRIRSHDDAGAWTLSRTLSAGPLFAARRYHAIYYDVDAAEVRPDRSAYRARGGYSGARAGIYLGLRRARWNLGVGVSGDWLTGAAFDGSPLLDERTSVTAGVGVIYSFWRRGHAADDAADSP